MRPVRFIGYSLKCLRDFPEDARHHAGYPLDKVQRGEQPDDSKPMPAPAKPDFEPANSAHTPALAAPARTFCHPKPTPCVTPISPPW
jgi:hypothetical protein